ARAEPAARPPTGRGLVAAVADDGGAPHGWLLAGDLAEHPVDGLRVLAPGVVFHRGDEGGDRRAGLPGLRLGHGAPSCADSKRRGYVPAFRKRAITPSMSRWSMSRRTKCPPGS